MTHRAPLAVVLVTLVPAGAGAVTLRVPDDFATIQAGIDAAAAGDTVLVGPGTWSQWETRVYDYGEGAVGVKGVVFLKNGVVVRSEEGPAATTLDVSGASGGIVAIVFGGWLTAGTSLEGFTLVDTQVGGNAIRLGRSELLVHECVFTGIAGSSYGGAMRVERSALEVSASEFRECSGGELRGGGAVYFEAEGDVSPVQQLDIRDCLFEGCDRPVTVVDESYVPDFTVAVSDCVFRDNVTSVYVGSTLAVYAYGSTRVERCRFEGNVAPSGDGVAIRVSQGSLDVSECEFLFNEGLWSPAVDFAYGEVTVSRSTFYGNVSQIGSSALALREADAFVSLNIFAENAGRAVRASNSQVTMSCNVFWNNTGQDTDGLDRGVSSVNVDPQFCDVTAGDFRVAASSICLPENSPFGCGAIGLLGVGCPDLGTVPSAFRTVPNHLNVVVDGVSGQTPTAHNWTPGTSHPVVVPDTVSSGGTRYLFSSWDDGGASSRTIIAASTPTFYTARYDTSYFLTMRTSTNEGTVSPASAWHPIGTAVPIVAFADSGFYFKSWSGSGPGSYTGPDSATAVRMLGPIVETANFTRDRDITFASEPEVGLSVQVDFEFYVMPVTFRWQRATLHNVWTPTLQNLGPGERYDFLSWDPPLSTPLGVPDEDRTYTARFQPEYFLTMVPAIGGTSRPGDGWYDEGSEVRIRAKADPRYYFGSWTGEGEGSYSGPDPTVTISMNGPIRETPKFHRIATEVALSLSETDPDVHTGAPLGFGDVWLWFVCATRGGFTGLDANVTGDMQVFGFMPAPGILNASPEPDRVDLASTNCESGPRLLGRFIVQDPGGELVLAPSSATGLLRCFDCTLGGGATDYVWPADMKATGVNTGGGPPSSSGPPCRVRDVPGDLAALAADARSALVDEATPTALRESWTDALESIHPNPFRSRATVCFTAAREGPVTLSIYDVAGRLVRRPLDRAVVAGRHEAEWDGRDGSGAHVPSGVYFARLSIGGFRETRRIVLVRRD